MKEKEPTPASGGQDTSLNSFFSFAEKDDSENEIKETKKKLNFDDSAILNDSMTVNADKFMSSNSKLVKMLEPGNSFLPVPKVIS